MNDRSALSIDDFVGNFGAGAGQESEETTPLGDLEDKTAVDETVETEAEHEEEQPEQEDASAEDVDDVEDSADDEDVETSAEDEDEVEATEEESVEDEDTSDEEVPEESFKWDDNREVEIPNLGKMTLGELSRGYSREDDYTRKTQKLAARERELTATVDAEKEVLTNERQQLTERLEALDATLDVMREQFKAEELSVEQQKQLYKEDPDAFQEYQFEALTRKSRLEEAEKQASEAKAHVQRADEAKAQEAEKAHKAYLVEQRNALIEVRPEWSDDGTLDQSLRDFSKLIEPYGFTQDEVYQITEARQLLLLDGLAKANAENARLQGELDKAVVKAKKVESAKPALKKKVTKAAKRIKPVSSEPVQPKDKATAFRDRIMKKHGAMTGDEFAKYHSLGGR